MKHLKTAILISLSAFLLSSCGGGKSTGPGTNPDPGTGSNSLVVTALVSGVAAGAGVFTSSFSVTVLDSMAVAVNDAQVTINHAAFSVMTLVQDPLQPGVYTGTANSYNPGAYTLNVTRGTDIVSNAIVNGPDVHTITAPTTTDVLSSGLSFNVTWTSAAAATEAEIQTKDLAATITADNGAFSVPASSVARVDQEVTVRRRNSVTPGGGRAGSTFKAEISVSVQPLVVKSSVPSLIVTALVSGVDAGAGVFTSSFSVTVLDSLGVAVNDAQVTISHTALSVMTLMLDPLQPGVYTGSVNSYNSGAYTLNVVRGTDFVTNAVVNGPDVHTITAPTTTDVLRPDLSFNVTWTSAAAATEAEIETKDFAATITADNGTYSVPASGVSRADQQVTVRRRNSMTPADARAGSTFKAEISVSVQPIVVMSNLVLVNGSVNGSDIGGGLFATTYLVVLKDDLDNPIINATVTFANSQTGTVSLTEEPLIPGTYSSAEFNYFEGIYTLNVTSTIAVVTDATVLGPDLHTITTPLTLGVVSSTLPFTLLWAKTTTAGEALIETSDFGPEITVDDGSFDVPASFNPRTDLRIRITRKNTGTIPNTRAGSGLSASIRNAVEDVVVQ